MNKNSFDFLAGYKTYLSILIAVVLVGLRSLDYIDESSFEILLTLAGALGLYGVRKAIDRKK